MNLARLFSYTQNLESQLAEQKEQRAVELANLSVRYVNHINDLKEQLDEERKERRRLQDRLLQKVSSPPIFEPQPERQTGEGHSERLTGRQAAIQKGKAHAEEVFASVKTDVQRFVKEKQLQQNREANGVEE